MTNLKALNWTKTICLLIIGMQFLGIHSELIAQYYVEESRLIGGLANPSLQEVYKDHLYVIGSTNDANFPTTDGSTNNGQSSLLFLKYDNLSTNILEAKVLENFNGRQMIIKDDYIYVFASTTNQLLSHTGSPSSGMEDIYILKLDLNGNLVDATYFGGQKDDWFDHAVIHGDTLSLVMTTRSIDVPLTNNSTYNGNGDLVYAQFDAVTLGLRFASYIGGSEYDYNGIIQTQGPTAYIGYTTRSSDIPAAGSDTLNGPYDIAFTKVELATGNILSSTYLGGSERDYLLRFILKDSQLLVYGVTYSPDFPLSTTPQNYNWTVFARLDTNLNQLAGAHLSSLDETNAIFFKEHDGFLYAIEYPDEDEAELIKFDYDGNIEWRHAPGNNNRTSGLEIYGDKIFTLNNGYPDQITESCSYSGSEYLEVLSLDGDVVYTNFYQIVDAYSGWAFVDSARHFLVGRVYSFNNCFPTTDNSQGSGLYTQLINVQIPGFQGDPNPEDLSQTVCKNGLVEPIKMDPFLVSGTTLPILYECGTQNYQCDIEAVYQWQQANSTAGPWTDILGGNSPNFSPSPVISTTYFRRLARENKCPGSTLVQTSTVHSVIVNQHQAPYVDAGGVYYTCPGSSVTLNSTIISGTPPYQYEWYAGNSATIAGIANNLTVTPSANGSVIYTLYVTDANGCKQLDQAIVHAVTADAGPDVSYCESQPAPSIGGGNLPILGVSYQWSPAIGLSCTTCLHPIASPAVTTQYTLTTTFPVTGGIGTCVTTDQVTVTPIDAPSQNFAGVDTLICSGDTPLIGGPAESGFSYEWSPRWFLQNDYTTPSPARGYCGNPNPKTLTLKASRQSCEWEDQVDITVLCAWVGNLTCGPGTIGYPDNSPNLNETYQWTQLSGDGMIIGPTNMAQTSVSASISIPSVYQLEVSYNGTTCTNTITVSPCTIGGIDVNTYNNCPNLNTNPDACIRVSASNFPYPATVVWTPQVGLSSYSSNYVCLTDTIHRTYTVTMTSLVDSTISVTTTVEVNNPAWTIPEFNALDTLICPNVPVNIGEPSKPGYTYYWYPSSGLNNQNIANPTATISSTTQYIVRITNTATGCSTRDTALIFVSTAQANAGGDVIVCDNASLVIGSPAQPNVTYSWQPAGAAWQNGTDQFSAQPEVLVGLNTTFTLTTLDTITGCVDVDVIDVSVGNAVVPFLLQDITYCSPQSIQLGVGVPSGYTSYLWSPAANLSSPNIPMPTLFPPSNVPVEYTLVVTNQSGCQLEVKQTVAPNAVVPIVESPKTICEGEYVHIGSFQNVTGPGITYSWSPVTDLDDPSSPNPLVTGSTTGLTTYTVTVNNNGCTNSASVDVTVNASGFSLPSKTICAGSCVTIGTTPTTGATYQWVPAFGLDDPTIANPTACVTSDTIYTLIYTGPTGCQTNVEVPVYIHPEPAPQVTVPPLVVCLGGGGDTLKPVVAPTGSYTYNWAPNNGTLDYPYVETPSVILFTAGTHTYDVTVTNAVSGCSTESSVDVIAGDCSDPNFLCTNLDICLEIGIDPDHPLTTIDCDGDGVTNEDECSDGTDPLDPCDYVDTSITLPVTADQSACGPTCPDLTPTVRILPGNISGNSVVQVAVRISEIHNIDTDGTVISVRIPSDPRLLFVWDIGMTYAAFTPVQNADWNYLGDNGIFHNWTYNGPGLIINGQTTSAFGFIGFYDPQGTNGQTNITATVVPFSGGECNLINNSDSELLIYFQ